MKTISLYVAGALVIISGVTGVAIGYAYTPEYTLSMYDRSTMNLGAADRWLDLRYVNAMIAHHRGAMLLAEQAQKSTRPEVSALAKDILANEPKAIDALYVWKKDWYGDTRRVPDPTLVHLGDVDATFDLRFLNALIAHHALGITMTKDVRIKSSRSAVLDNADAVEAFLSGGMTMLSGWRSEWYKI
jgi:uncharacterized protein (DUF305 family)